MGPLGHLALAFVGLVAGRFRGCAPGLLGYLYGRLGAQLKFNPTWGVSGDVKFVDGDTQWFVGPRVTW